MVTITSVRVDAIDAINGAFQRLGARPPSEVDQHDVTELCRNFRILAVAGLLVEADVGKFSANLARAGSNWSGLLRHCRASGIRAPKMSDLVNLYGCLAGGHLTMAAEIARLVMDQDRQPNEYPAEHAFARLFVQLVLMPERGVESVRSLADELLAIGGDLASERAAMACALVEADAQGFYAAFAAATAVRELQTEQLANAFTTDWRTFVIERYVWLEGIAWLRLAAARALPRPRDFLYCPSLALDVVPPAHQPDWMLPAFRTVS